MNMVVYVYIV